MSRITPLVIAFIGGAVASHMLRKKRSSVVRAAVNDIKNETPLKHITPENVELVKEKIVDLKDLIVDRATETLSTVERVFTDTLHNLEEQQKNMETPVVVEENPEKRTIAPEPRKSVLQDRIDAGLADPISDEERTIAAGMINYFDKKFGKRVDPIDDEERSEAARVVMKMDKKLGLKTHPEVRKLAEGKATEAEVKAETNEGTSNPVFSEKEHPTAKKVAPAPTNSMKPDEWAKNLITKSAPIRSALQDRISKGLAEPISEREKEQLSELKKMYENRFGKRPTE